MIWFLSTLAFVGLGCVAVLVTAVLWKVALDGPAEIRKLRRHGYGVKTLFTGELGRCDEGSTIDVMEGLEFVAEGGRVRSVRQKRTISAEIL